MNAAEGVRASGPYVGLEPFQAEDQVYFRGRESDQRVVIANLRTAPLTILYGAAGVGKSSLLLAGVVPQLQEMLPPTPVVVFRDWIVSDFPRRLARACIDAAWSLGSDQPRPKDDRPLDEILCACAQAVGRTLLVILDQFEDYLQDHPKSEDPNSFEAQFARSVNREEVDVGFLISVREASVPKLDRFRERIPQLLGNTLRLRHLDEQAARDAIGQPLLDVWNQQHPREPSMTIEPALVEQVIRDAQTDPTHGSRDDTGVLPSERVIEAPFLQLVMSRLWQIEREQGSTVLRLETLQQRLGGARNIVRTHLDEAMAKLDAGQRDICAQFFDRLVTPSGRRIPCNSDDLLRWAGGAPAQAVRDTLEALSQERVLRTTTAEPDSPEQTRYEVFHEVWAPAILAWKRSYDERKARQAAVARVKQRSRMRLLAVAAAAFTLLLVLTLSGYVVSLRKAGADRRAFQSVAIGQSEPARALKLAVRAADFLRLWGLDLIPPTAGTESALRLATQASLRETSTTLEYKVMAVAVSRGGDLAVTREALVGEPRASRLRVWDIGSRPPRKLAERLLPDPNLQGRVAFLPGRDTVVAVAGSSAWLWQYTAASEPMVELPHGMQIHAALAVSADGQRIATAGSRETSGVRSGSIKLWRLSSEGAVEERAIDTGVAWIMGLAFSPDGCCLASAAVTAAPAIHPSHAAVWSVTSGRRLLDVPASAATNTVAFAPDGDTLALGDRDNMVVVLRAANGRLSKLLNDLDHRGSSAEVIWNTRVLGRHQDTVRTVSFSDDGARLASASGDESIVVWDAIAGDRLFHLEGHKGWVDDAAFGPSGQQLVSASRDRSFRLWSLNGHTGPVNAIAFNPDGARAQLATASADRTAKLWDRSGDIAQFAALLGEHGGVVYRVAYSPRGDVLATASFDGKVRLFDAATGKLLRLLEGHRDQLRDLAFSPDGSLLVTAGADGKGLLHDLSDSAVPLVPVKHGKEQASAVAFHPDGQRWATGGWDGVIRLWDTRGTGLGSIPKHESYPKFDLGRAPIVRLLFLRRGQDVAVLIGRHLYVWPTARFERDDGQPPGHVVVAEDGQCQWMAVSRDGARLAVVCDDGAVRMYKVKSGVPEHSGTFAVHRDAVLGADFSPDGRTLATCSRDGSVQISPLAFDELLALARRRLEALSVDAPTAR